MDVREVTCSGDERQQGRHVYGHRGGTSCAFEGGESWRRGKIQLLRLFAGRNALTRLVDHVDHNVRFEQ